MYHPRIFHDIKSNSTPAATGTNAAAAVGPDAAVSAFPDSVAVDAATSAGSDAAARVAAASGGPDAAVSKKQKQHGCAEHINHSFASLSKCQKQNHIAHVIICLYKFIYCIKP